MSVVVVQLNILNCILPFDLVHFSRVDEANDSTIFLQPIHPTFRKGYLNLQRVSCVSYLQPWTWYKSQIQQGKIKQMAGWLPTKVARNQGLLEDDQPDKRG